MRSGLAVLGALMTIGVWLFDSELALRIQEAVSLTGSQEILRLGVRGIGLLLLVGCSAPLVLSLRMAYRIPSAAAVVALALGGVDFLGAEVFATVSGYLAIGTPIALAIAGLLGWFGEDSGE